MKTFTKRILLLASILLIWNIAARHVNHLFIPSPVTVFKVQGKASVTFIQNTAKFSDSASASKELNKFIDIAKVLDGSIIEIAGNTDPNPESDPEDEYNQKLSLQRAEAVKNYFVMNGISNGRIVVVGNGSSNPVVDNDTDEHRAMNRRTDVSFKIIE